MESTDILIVGGGAAGMMAALAASKNGADVLIIEKMGQLGKKILVTGNGKCNYTNYYQSEECYRGSCASFAWKALQEFGQKETVELFKTYGIMPADRDGYVYPLSGQASSVRNILEREIESAKIQVNKGEKVLNIKIHINNKTGKQDGFIARTDKGNYFARKIIVATGGKAGAVHGSDGSGYNIAKSLGHSVITPLPALVPCILDENYLKDWAGVRTTGSVKVYSEEGRFLCEDTGELQFVQQGISGIPVFQVSRYVSIELNKGKRPYLVIDILPGYSKEEIATEIARRRRQFINISTGSLFDGMLNSRLAKALLKKCGISLKRPAKTLTEAEIKRIANIIKKWCLAVKTVGDFDKAQVTCGGMPAAEINAGTLESEICQGLYFAGEIIDIDGKCGGYNLQWAWTSGYIAGNAAAVTLHFSTPG